jgi:hypothetical protein
VCVCVCVWCVCVCVCVGGVSCGRLRCKLLFFVLLPHSGGGMEERSFVLKPPAKIVEKWGALKNGNLQQNDSKLVAFFNLINVKKERGPGRQPRPILFIEI